ncbi:hypothetical protein [Methylotuvimicrobium sp. KM1]|uniref:hypothetical protein n=1 Tax=Methylotuvimicrobium sp. KM1 TaxID=3377707 RepID=UPI00385147F6
MEKRTAAKAEKWNNELAVQRSRRKETDQRKQREQKVSSGEYIPRRYTEPVFGDNKIKARNNERLLLYFFIGVIACIVVWKGFDVIRERYWMDELKAGNQKRLTTLEHETRKSGDDLKKLPSGYRPANASNYQFKTQDVYKGSVCKDHVKTEIYERTTLRCDKNSGRCTTISSKTYNKKGDC